MLTEHFSHKEMACKCCGECRVDGVFMSILEDIRVKYGKPMIVSSGYRCPKHNESVSETGAKGPHTTGKAVDIAIGGKSAYNLLKAVMEDNRITGIGIKQSGSSRFIHLDILEGATRPWCWTY